LRLPSPFISLQVTLSDPAFPCAALFYPYPLPPFIYTVLTKPAFSLAVSVDTHSKLGLFQAYCFPINWNTLTWQSGG
jgi:hypothetical protein